MNRVTLLLDSSGIGGIETHVLALAGALRRAGQSPLVMLLADHGEHAFLDRLRQSRLPYRVNHKGWKGLNRHLRFDGVELLHTHGYKAGILGRTAARLARVPVVSTFHAGERAAFPVSLYQSLDEWTSLLGERIAVSSKIAERLPFSAELLPNFVEIPEFRDPPVRRSQIGFVGRLSMEKAPDRFCRIAEAFSDRADFHAFGEGPMRQSLETVFGRNVRFHGLASDMGKVWRSLDLLLMPSRAEGLPMAALEAIAHGVPVFATDVGDLSTVVEGGWAGALIENGSDDAVIGGFAAQLALWHDLSRGSRLALSRAAYEHARRRFGEERAIAQVLKVYAKTLSSTTSS